MSTKKKLLILALVLLMGVGITFATCGVIGGLAFTQWQANSRKAADEIVGGVLPPPAKVLQSYDLLPDKFGVFSNGKETVVIILQREQAHAPGTPVSVADIEKVIKELQNPASDTQDDVSKSWSRGVISGVLDESLEGVDYSRPVTINLGKLPVSVIEYHRGRLDYVLGVLNLDGKQWIFIGQSSADKLDEHVSDFLLSLPSLQKDSHYPQFAGRVPEKHASR